MWLSIYVGRGHPRIERRDKPHLAHGMWANLVNTETLKISTYTTSQGDQYWIIEIKEDR